jgi:hypothetical protein
MRIWQQAEFDALNAGKLCYPSIRMSNSLWLTKAHIETYLEGLHHSQQDVTSRDVESFEDCVKSLRESARTRSGLSSLLSQRLGWSCSADVDIAHALAEQVDALTWEREALQSEIARDTASGTASASEDAGRLLDLGRTLREAKVELEAAKMRIEELDGWNDPMGDRAFSVQVLMKAGRSAL